MGKKYIIELEDNESVYKTIIANGYPMLQVIVPSPYAEPDLEQVRNEAYEKGFDAGRMLNKCKYEKGLNDAWEAAKKIADTTYDVERKIFDCCDWDVVKTFTAAEAIEKLKAYEQEQDAEINVGDEVELDDGGTAIWMCKEDSEFAYLLYSDGSCGSYEKRKIVRKTGRHFPEIATAIQKMRGEQE